MAERLLLIPRSDPRKLVLDVVPENAICAEVGVYRGEFAEMIVRQAKPAQLHLIDPWKYEGGETYSEALYGGATGGSQARMDEMYESVCDRFRREISEEVVTIHRGASAEVGASFPDNYFDWVYIDANHQYEFVKQDLEVFYSKVKPGGFITGDDFGVAGWWDHGVTRAVSEMISSGRCTPVKIWNSQFILRKSP